MNPAAPSPSDSSKARALSEFAGLGLARMQELIGFHATEIVYSRAREIDASAPAAAVGGDDDWNLRGYHYASKQATNCADCGEYKHTPLRVDAMGGYVCLTCIDKKLGSMLGEFGYPAAPVGDQHPTWRWRINEGEPQATKWGCGPLKDAPKGWHIELKNTDWNKNGNDAAPVGRFVVEACQHEWEQDADNLDWVYCPKCDISRKRGSHENECARTGSGAGFPRPLPSRGPGDTGQSSTLESLAAQLVAEFPMVAIVRAFNNAAPGMGAALSSPTAQPSAKDGVRGAENPCGLPARDPSKPDTEQGLYKKYEDIIRTDGQSEPGCKHYDCEYFVIDVTHDRAAKAALSAYADFIETTHPLLAEDMREQYELATTAAGLVDAARKYMAAVDTMNDAMKDGGNVHGAISGLIGARDNLEAAIGREVGT